MRSLAYFVLCLIPSVTMAEGVLSQAIEGYKASCLAAAPTFVGVYAKAKRAGFIKKDGLLTLPDFSASIELVQQDGTCACLTSMIAPDADRTATRVIKATLGARHAKQHPSPHKEITAIVEWPDGTNALQVEADTRGQVPMVKAYLISQGTCPKE